MFDKKRTGIGSHRVMSGAHPVRLSHLLHCPFAPLGPVERSVAYAAADLDPEDVHFSFLGSSLELRLLTPVVAPAAPPLPLHSSRPAMPTLYDLLEIAPCAQPEEVRQAFKRRAMAVHPDSEEAGLRHRRFKIGSKSVPRPLPGSERTRFSSCVQPRRRGWPPKARRPWASIFEVRISKLDLRFETRSEGRGR